MKCKVCGYVPDSHVRFCPNCQSYFVDADKPESGITWNGLMDENGKISPPPDMPKPASQSSTQPRRGMAIADLIICSINLLLVVLGALVSEDLMMLAAPLFIVGLTFFFIAKRNRLAWFALVELVFAFILFMWRFA